MSHSSSGVPETPLSFKIILLGDSNVGKTCFLRQFIQGEFSLCSAPTVCVDFASRTYQIDEFSVRLNIFDTAGQERHRSLTRAYLKGTDAVLFMYAMDNRKNFENLKQWIQFFQEEGDVRDELRVLVGTKNDLLSQTGSKPPLEKEHSPSYPDRIDKVQIKQLVESHHFVFKFETSAKTNTNINLVFEQLSRNLIYNSIQRRQSANLIRQSEWALILKRDRDHLLREEERNKSCC